MTNARSKAALSHESKLFTVDTLLPDGARSRTFVFRTDKDARAFKRAKKSVGVGTTPVRRATWGPKTL